jgi:hypothetical protein
MKRLLTAMGFAMACAVGLAAQQTTGTTGTSGTTADQAGQGRGGPRTVTGCLRAGDTAGTYMLTDIQMGDRTGATTGTTSGTSTTSGSTTTSGTSATTGQRGQMPTSLTLNPESSVDLKAHVGHKVEVTGTMAGGGRRGGDTTTSSTSGTTGTMTGGGTTGESGQSTTEGGQRAGTRTMNVTSVRMISESCSQ